MLFQTNKCIVRCFRTGQQGGVLHQHIVVGDPSSSLSFRCSFQKQGRSSRSVKIHAAGVKVSFFFPLSTRSYFHFRVFTLNSTASNMLHRECGISQMWMFSAGDARTQTFPFHRGHKQEASELNDPAELLKKHFIFSSGIFFLCCVLFFPLWESSSV